MPSFHLDLPSADLGNAMTARQLRHTAGQYSTQQPNERMHSEHSQPYHAHIYCDAENRAVAQDLQRRFRSEVPGVLFVGTLKEANAGPHPKAQFEVHFSQALLPAVRRAIVSSGLTALIHPLTDDDLADHTSLAEWIGTPLALDLSTLDPPGHNQGVARFGKSDF